MTHTATVDIAKIHTVQPAMQIQRAALSLFSLLTRFGTSCRCTSISLRTSTGEKAASFSSFTRRSALCNWMLNSTPAQTVTIHIDSLNHNESTSLHPH